MRFCSGRLTVPLVCHYIAQVIAPVASAAGCEAAERRLPLYMRRTNVYIDGFNLYYGAIKGTKYHWLNLADFCRVTLPQNTIQTIKYFTAIVANRGTDPDQIVRQQTYHRALRTLPNLEIHLGSFLTQRKKRPLTSPPPGGERFVEVWETHEKGSDVNLATHLVADAYENLYDVAIVMSNDSDLVAPIRLVRERLGKVVGVVNPQEEASVVLRANVDFIKHVHKHRNLLRHSQFPDVVLDAAGRKIVKPDEWR